MNRHWFANHSIGRSAVLLAVVVTAGLGVCLFDGHDHGDDFMARDLCVGLFVVALPGIVFAGLVVVGVAPSWFAAGLVAVPIPVLDPPPKLAVR